MMTDALIKAGTTRHAHTRVTSADSIPSRSSQLLILLIKVFVVASFVLAYPTVYIYIYIYIYTCVCCMGPGVA